MYRIVLLVAVLLGRGVCMAMVGVVPYENWDIQAKNVVRDIVSNPNRYEGTEGTARLKKVSSALIDSLSTLQGGAYRVYCEFLERWQTGDSENDVVPESLDSLATKIYQLLRGCENGEGHV